jgi:hypothetical protein
LSTGNLYQAFEKGHLLSCAHHSSLRRTAQYASILMILRALHPGIFEQPVLKDFFNILPEETTAINSQ